LKILPFFVFLSPLPIKIFIKAVKVTKKGKTFI
jgi:hypothetical protein